LKRCQRIERAFKVVIFLFGHDLGPDSNRA